MEGRLYGNQITVSWVRFNSRQAYWRKVVRNQKEKTDVIVEDRDVNSKERGKPDREPDRSSNLGEEEVESSQESDEALNAASLGKWSLGNSTLFQTSLETGLEDSELKGDIFKKITGEDRNLKKKNLKDKIHGNNNMKEKNLVEIIFKNQLMDSGLDIEMKEKLEASSEIGREADKSKWEGMEMKLDKRANEDTKNMGFTSPKSINSGKNKSNEEKKPVQQNSSLPETQIEKEFEEAIPENEEED
ncbi:hypothetical protein V6N12_061083 [Hibiscus sabdariffa]|uniref:Uncharacterized protein n=1 Tax=Hibiscus sabdariffa TaxID=183260 RepID=A0ABR2DXP4_9ROSI